MTLRGIDISNNDGWVDWPKVAAAGIDLSICKVSEGQSFVDHTFVTNTRGAHGLTIYTGAYHFARPSRNTPRVEAEFFARCLMQSGVLGLLDMHRLATPHGKLPDLWCDQEDPDVSGTAPLGAWTETFCDAVEQILQRDCGAYLSPGWFASHNQDAPPGLGDKDLWVASYGVSHPSLVRPWTRWTIWQYSDKGRVPGISVNVDMDDVEATPITANQEEPMNVSPSDGTKVIALTGRACKILISADQPATVRLAFGSKGKVAYVSPNSAEAIPHIDQVVHALPAGNTWASISAHGNPVGVTVDEA